MKTVFYFLFFSFFFYSLCNPVDQYVLDTNDFESEAQVLHRGELLNVYRQPPAYVDKQLRDAGTCIGVKCTDFSVQFSSSVVESNCSTTFCYAVSNNAIGFSITEADIYGAIFDSAQFSSTLPSWKIYAGNVIVYAGVINPGKTMSLCFNLPGKYDLNDGYMLINTQAASCSFAVKVPGRVWPCGSGCILDYNLVNAQCSQCTAKCTVPGNYYAVAKGVCTLNVVKTADPGMTCQSAITTDCTVPCPVDCKTSGPFFPPCSSCCKRPTATVTGFFSTVTRPANGGISCPGQSTVTSVCSMAASEYIQKCDIDCTVAGLPRDPCPSACFSNNMSPTVTTAKFPTTIRTSTLGGKTCLTATYTCNCQNCVLGTLPTYTATCDATCATNDDSTALGKQIYYYSVVTPAIAGGSSCVSTSTATCSTKCSCKYTSVYVESSCTFTTTQTSSPTWVAQGIKTAYLYADAPVCFKTTTTTCRSTISPVDCEYYVDCSVPKCTTTTGNDYILQSTYPCSISATLSAQNGGRRCPTTAPTTSVFNTCPGCQYYSSLCGCSYVSSAQGTQSGITLFMGYETCVYPGKSFSAQTGANGALTPFYSCQSRTSSNTAKTCTSTVSNTDCVYVFKNCDNCGLTSLNTVATPWVSYGAQLCSYTDLRATTPGQSSCLGSTITQSCSSTLVAIDCTSTTVCDACLATCPTSTAGNFATATAQCSYATYRPAQNGGKNCSSFAANAPPTTCSTSCSPSPTQCSGMENCKFNLVIFDTANITFSNIEGCLAVGKNANLLNTNVGTSSNYPLLDCDNECPALYVGEDLVISGMVQTGKALVGGMCSDTDFSKCSKLCGIKKDQCYCHGYSLNFDCVEKRARNLSSILSAKTPNIKLTPTTNGVVINVGTGLLLVANINGSAGSGSVLGNRDFKTVYLSTGQFPNNATIIVNIFGSSVLIDNVNMDSLAPYSKYIIWNFPEATQLIIRRTTIYGGMLLAPMANLLGDANIIANVFVRSVSLDNGKSPIFGRSSYLGLNFTSFP